MGPILDLNKLKRKRGGKTIKNDIEPLQLDVMHMSLDEIIEARKQQQNGSLIGKDGRCGPGKKLARMKRDQRRLRQVVRRFNSDMAIPTRIGITNLSYLVNEVDLKTLFNEIGPIDFVTVYYDRYGSSLGMAEIIYKSRRDANAAIKHFNNVKLDNRKMHIHMLPDKRHLCSACFYSRKRNKRTQNINASIRTPNINVNVRTPIVNADVRTQNVNVCMQNVNVRTQNLNASVTSAESDKIREELDNDLDEYSKRFSKITI